LHASVLEINRRMGEQDERAAALAAAGTLLSQKTMPALSQVQGLLRDIRQNGVTTLTASSNDLSAISGQMNQGSEQTSSQANTIRYRIRVKLGDDEQDRKMFVERLGDLSQILHTVVYA
jgi:hypothetical protein